MTSLLNHHAAKFRASQGGEKKPPEAKSSKSKPKPAPEPIESADQDEPDLPPESPNVRTTSPAPDDTERFGRGDLAATYKTTNIGIANWLRGEGIKILRCGNDAWRMDGGDPITSEAMCAAANVLRGDSRPPFELIKG